MRPTEKYCVSKRNLSDAERLFLHNKEGICKGREKPITNPLTYRRYGGKGTKMKWFELNNGNLVDLEKVYCIEIDARVIVYRFTEAESCAELFELPSKAQQRMEELKKLLK